MRHGMIVGLTGQTGAGKSTVAEFLSRFGYKVIPADEYARLATEKGSPVLKELQAAFGQDTLKEDGTLNRPKLAELAFATPEQTAKLNAITHPFISHLMQKQIRGAFFDGYEAVILDASQLFEAKQDQFCNLVISVTAPEEVRKARIMERDGLNAEEAERRMHAQLPEDYFLTHSDIVIENKQGTDHLHKLTTKAAQIIESYIAGEE
jgi:dephospho-CoA kinase